MGTVAQWLIPTGECSEGDVLLAAIKCINGVWTAVWVDAAEFDILGAPAGKKCGKCGDVKLALVQLAKEKDWTPADLKELFLAV